MLRQVVIAVIFCLLLALVGCGKDDPAVVKVPSETAPDTAARLAETNTQNTASPTDKSAMPDMRTRLEALKPDASKTPANPQGGTTELSPEMENTVKKIMNFMKQGTAALEKVADNASATTAAEEMRSLAAEYKPIMESLKNAAPEQLMAMWPKYQTKLQETGQAFKLAITRVMANEQWKTIMEEVLNNLQAMTGSPDPAQ